MSVETYRILGALAVAIAAALVAAFVAAFLAVRRTKVETRWHAKYQAYQRILGSVEDIRYWAEEHYADSLSLPTVGPDRLKAAFDRYQEAKRALWSYVNIGALVVCNAARKQLEEMLGEVAREEWRYENEPTDEAEAAGDLATHCDHVRGIVAKHLPEIVASAKEDLA